MPAPLIDDEEPYASSEDSDFAPDTENGPAAEDSDQSASESEAAVTTKQQSAKRNAPSGQGAPAEDAGYDNSGDEAIIKKGERKRRKGKSKDEIEDEDGGEGGLIKTRRQRAAEKEERRIAASSGPVTIDVDAVWAQMLTGQVTTNSRPNQETDGTADDDDPMLSVQTTQPITDTDSSNLVRIKRTYNFAGQVHTEEKLVPRDSAEARLFIASGGQAEAVEGNSGAMDLQPTKRVAKKAFRSSFEPVVDLAQPRRADLDLGVEARMRAGRDARAKKLNTVEKSRMDWAGFVDKEGIKDELELAGRSKTSYAARQDFLQRSEMRREDEARRARLAGKA